MIKHEGRVQQTREQKLRAVCAAVNRPTSILRGFDEQALSELERLYDEAVGPIQRVYDDFAAIQAASDNRTKPAETQSSDPQPTEPKPSA